jgi:F-type H+-transporting ATPase subunit b
MSTFRIAASSLVTGLALFLLATGRVEGLPMTMLLEPEFWVAVGFAIVIAILLWQRVPRTVATMLDARAGAISKELDEARRLRDEAAALLASYVQKAATAENEAAGILAQAKADAEAFAKETRAQLRAQIDRRAQMAKDKIAQAEAAAMAEIRARAADIASLAAEKIIASRLDEQRAGALIEESIKGLPEKLN